ncbi:MAG: 1,4-alpha-glucan branching protein domain-containing protein [Gemmatimonadota bacterium]
MDFVLALHSHLPWVLNHGRWPHGSDWLCEAAVDTYLPLLEELEALAEEGVRAPVTIGFTPVLANQLASPVFALELEAFFEQRLVACDEAIADLGHGGDSQLVELVEFWRRRFERLRNRFRFANRDLISAFRRLEDEGQLEIIGSAATHGFLPLLGRDESIRFQLALGRHEHRRLFGRLPAGCWLPECAYRPRGEWAPMAGAPYTGIRRGIDEHLGDAGFQFFFTDSHMANAGTLVRSSGDPASMDEFDRHVLPIGAGATRSPYRSYRVMPARTGRTLAALVRDPRTSQQVWSRHEGYPGDEAYLEFHKIRWPGGLKLWRVSAPGRDLGAKQSYDPNHAFGRAGEHGRHFASVLSQIAAADRSSKSGVIAAPFDTELFGHWWFEGPAFVGAAYRALEGNGLVRPTTASAHLQAHPARTPLRLAAGSWGAEGDWSMWLNDRTAWTWRRLWPLETAFWDLAPVALNNPAAWPVLAQAARALLLAQSSDWQFIISTGAVADYAVRRISEHCDDLEQLLAALRGGEGGLEAGQRLADEQNRRDGLFPDVLPALALALRGSRAL